MDTLAVVEGESNNHLVAMHTSSISRGDWCKKYTIREQSRALGRFERKRNGIMMTES